MARVELLTAGIIIGLVMIALSLSCNLAPRAEYVQNFAPQNCVYDAKQVRWVCSDVSQGPGQDSQSGGDASGTGDSGSGQ